MKRIETHGRPRLDEEVSRELKPYVISLLRDLTPEARRLDGEPKTEHPVGATLTILSFVDSLPIEVREYFRASGTRVALTRWGIGFSDTCVGYAHGYDYSFPTGFGLIKPGIYDFWSGLLTRDAIVKGWDGRHGGVSRGAITRLAQCTRVGVIEKILSNIYK